MKKTRGQTDKQQKKFITHQSFRPEIRDDLDNREGEEQDTKGSDVTHNRKEKKAGHLKDRGKDRTR